MKSSHIKRLLLIIGAFTIAGCSLFDVLTPDVVDVNTFKSRLQQTFPSYSTMIDTTFSSPNF